MKIREGFVLRKVADNYVVVPVGAATVDFNGMITLNGTGAFLFEKLIEGISEEELIESLLEEYDVDEDKARDGVTKFLAKIEGAGLFE